VGQKYIIDAYTYTPDKKLKNLKEDITISIANYQRFQSTTLAALTLIILFSEMLKFSPPKNLMKFLFGRKSMESFFIFYFSK
jgi:hypothetical protein